jgi:hypothetical protein
MAGHDHSRVALSDTAMSTVRRSLSAILVLAASLPGQTLKQIATIDLPGPKDYQLLAKVPSALGARTAGYFGKGRKAADRFFLAVPARAGRGAEVWI